MMRKWLALLLVWVFAFGCAAAESLPEDGLYTIGVSSSAKMFRIVDCVLRVENDTLTAVLTLSGSGYGYLYQGTSAEANAAPVETWTPYFEDEEGRHCFVIEIPTLDAQIPMAAWSIRYSKWYDRTLQFFSNTMAPYQQIAPDGVYSAPVISDTHLDGKEAVLYSKDGEMRLEAEDLVLDLSSLDVKIPVENGWVKVDSQSLKPYCVAAPDGVYTVEVETDSALLKFTDCELTIADGEMTALLTAKNNNFDFIYLGRAADANADEQAWIAAVPDADGCYTYEIPVESLDNAFSVATYSAKKKMWYDREIMLDSTTLINK